MLENIIVIIILVSVIGLSSRYIYKAKKRGETCIGCSAGKQCSGHCKHESVDLR